MDAGEPRRRLKRIDSVARLRHEVSGDGLVGFGPAPGAERLPLLMRPQLEGVDLRAWAATNRRTIEGLLDTHGAILFRGFELPELSDFTGVVRAMSSEPLEYHERSSPRTHVAERVYTSTEYPADQPIFLHNENSYAHTFPAKLFFWCALAPVDRGATPIADCRQVFEAIAPEVRERFIRQHVLYVRNFGEHLGLPWQTAFGTSDRALVDGLCREAGYEVQWSGTGALRTRRVGPAVVRHPRTGESTWFNHATFFHVSTLPGPVRDALLAQCGEDELPNNTYYGDGSPIEPPVLDMLREAYHRATVTLPWQNGDVLLLDNMLTAHGREPFTGPRQIRVAMTEPCTAPPTA